jgi:hypothetical protein
MRVCAVRSKPARVASPSKPARAATPTSPPNAAGPPSERSTANSPDCLTYLRGHSELAERLAAEGASLTRQEGLLLEYSLSCGRVADVEQTAWLTRWVEAGRPDDFPFPREAREPQAPGGRRPAYWGILPGGIDPRVDREGAIKALFRGRRELQEQLVDDGAGAAETRGLDMEYMMQFGTIFRVDCYRWYWLWTEAGRPPEFEL